MLHPSPAMYAAFMGDVAMWTGIVTGSLMLCSPLLFDRFGWRGVAGATPRFMIATGVRLHTLPCSLCRDVFSCAETHPSSVAAF